MSAANMPNYGLNDCVLIFAEQRLNLKINKYKCKVLILIRPAAPHLLASQQI